MLMLTPTLAWLLVVVAGDSQAVLRRAQRAQAEFERSRWALLPPAPGRTGRCDAMNGAVIGRFCFWDDGSPPHLPPEPAAIGASRNRLLRVLDSTAAVLPGDEWIAGQRVRYLVEGGQTAAALTAARACGAEAWWCAALAGFALHAAGDAVAAESAYAAALRDMPQEERDRWNDLSFLVDGRLYRRYRQGTLAQRAAMAARLWWLAQPLLSRSGNDRRVEHYTRHTMARLLEHARSPFAVGFGDDLRELIVRYGWPIAWAREVREAVAVSWERGVVGHGREPAYHFVPDDLSGPGTSELEAEHARESYGPAYAAAFTTLDPTFATFRRGDSTLVAATYDVRDDTLFRAGPVAVALVLARGEPDSMVIVRRAGAGRNGTLVATAPWPARLASLELTDEPRAAGRARVVLAARDPDPGRLALSDLLLFEATDSLPGDLSAVLPHARPATVPRGLRLGLYWEVYGFAPLEPVAISVSVRPQERGLLRRVVESVGLASKARPRRLEWAERIRSMVGVAPRALEVDVATLPPGRYRIEVALAPAGREPVSASRAIRVVAR